MHTTYTPTNTTKAILRFFVAQPCRMFVVRFSQKKVIDAGHTVSCGKADWIHCSRLFQAFPEVRVQSSELCVTSVLPQQLVRTGIIQLMRVPLKKKTASIYVLQWDVFCSTKVQHEENGQHPYCQLAADVATGDACQQFQLCRCYHASNFAKRALVKNHKFSQHQPWHGMQNVKTSSD